MGSTPERVYFPFFTGFKERKDCGKNRGNRMSGFRNIQPLGREARRASGEALEKQRLAARREGFAREEILDHPISVETNSPMFVDEVSRFQTDAAAEEYHRRQALLNREKQSLEMHRKREEERETQRWKTMEEEERRERERAAAVAGTSKRNQSDLGAACASPRVAYDPLTLTYADTPEGRNLKDRDERAREWADFRMAELSRRNTNTDGINPITGEPITRRA
ncbi:hypothetical protein PAPYR_571 [Paratrimastix pyriformis]|uniref:Flagellar associated protein n=1 Tax=Paratrimastix pyriformis TaxID=342808 RepID=A0ABQ8UVY5_9EUKA|nr:hypothetical protein PAPYR_571 [Paratrimastix pyriformis]